MQPYGQPLGLLEGVSFARVVEVLLEDGKEEDDEGEIKNRHTYHYSRRDPGPPQLEAQDQEGGEQDDGERPPLDQTEIQRDLRFGSRSGRYKIESETHLISPFISLVLTILHYVTYIAILSKYVPLL